MDIEKSEAYQTQELSQAWDHYRHIEETRTKYLGFYGAAVAAATGFLVTILKEQNAFESIRLLTAATATACMLFAFSVVVWASVVRMGAVMNTYEHILEDSRARVHCKDHTLVSLWNVRSRLPDQVKRGIFSVHAGVEGTMLLTCWLLIVFTGVLAFFALSEPRFPFIAHLFHFVVPVAMLAMVIYAHIVGRLIGSRQT
jgi:hypothetical protein